MGRCAGYGPAVFDGLECVADEIQKHPLEGDCIDADRGKARVEILLDNDSVWRLGIDSSHSQRLMKYLMNVNWLPFEAMRSGDCQNLLHERSDAIYSIEDKAAIFLRARI